MPSGNDRFNAEAAAWDSNPDVHRASDGALQAILAAHPSLTTTSRGSKEKQGEADGDARPDVLEIGCGTGLLTLRLAPYVRSIVAVDAAEGMIEALRIKLEGKEGGAEGDRSGARGKISPLCMLLEDPEDERLPPAGAAGAAAAAAAAAASGSGAANRGGPRKKFDLITSHLVLHHIADLRSVLATMLGCLRPGTGEVALTDYEDFGPEARRFHPEARMAGVERHGVRAAWLAALMREVGFADVEVTAPAWVMEKEVERWPGEWGGMAEGEEMRRPAEGSEGAEVMGFPFLLARGRRREGGRESVVQAGPGGGGSQEKSGEKGGYVGGGRGLKGFV